MIDVDPRAVPGPEGHVTLFGVRPRGGIWQVTQDGRFYGHYMSDQPAFDAAQAAALAIVARGGAADIRWTERRPDAGATNHAKGLAAAPIGGARIAQFRAGSTRILP